MWARHTKAEVEKQALLAPSQCGMSTLKKPLRSCALQSSHLNKSPSATSTSLAHCRRRPLRYSGQLPGPDRMDRTHLKGAFTIVLACRSTCARKCRSMPAVSRPLRLRWPPFSVTSSKPLPIATPTDPNMPRIFCRSSRRCTFCRRDSAAVAGAQSCSGPPGGGAGPWSQCA